MLNIGLICEGPTDQKVLQRLVVGVAAGLPGEIEVTAHAIQPPQPMRPNLDFGGWELVFKSIQRRDVSGALAFNDLVIIQVDTDVCEEPNFGVSRREGERERTEAELTTAVADRVRAEIVGFDPEADLSRVVLAVCVDALECWLLLYWVSETAATRGCADKLERELRRKNESALVKGVANKEPRAYEQLARDLRKAKAVDMLVGRAPSFDSFVHELRAAIRRCARDTS